MDVGALQPLISATPLADVAACRAELVAITVVRGLLDARELEVVRRLDELAQTDGALFPQDVVARASRSSLSAAERLRDRAATAESVPELGKALAAGSTTGDRLDVVSRAAAGLSADEKAALAGHGARPALAAGSQTPLAAHAVGPDWRAVSRGRGTTGFTDIENLLPLCNRHHHLVHEGGWVLHLAPDRTLAVIRPGGSVSTRPPPRARAA